MPITLVVAQCDMFESMLDVSSPQPLLTFIPNDIYHCGELVYIVYNYISQDLE